MLACILSSGAGSAPAVDGYQIQEIPEGFLFTRLQSPSSGVLRGRDVVEQGMWVGDISLDEPRSTILVTRYAGSSGSGEAEAARSARVRRVGGLRYILVGPLRPLPLAAGVAVVLRRTRPRHALSYRLWAKDESSTSQSSAPAAPDADSSPTGTP